MMKWILVILGILGSAGAWAQTNSVPPFLGGQGTMALTSASQTINTANVTVTGASGPFPASRLPHQYLTVKVQGASTISVAVCWLGGTCTMASGEVIAGGETQTRNISASFAANPPTIIASTGTPTVTLEW